MNTGNTISQTEAEKNCKEKILGSLAVTQFKDLITSDDPDMVVEQCIFDLMVNKMTPTFVVAWYFRFYSHTGTRL